MVSEIWVCSYWAVLYVLQIHLSNQFVNVGFLLSLCFVSCVHLYKCDGIEKKQKMKALLALGQSYKSKGKHTGRLAGR